MHITHYKIKEKVKENLRNKYNEDFIDKTCDLIWRKHGIGRLIRENRSKFSVLKLFTFTSK